jgi:endonuclease/exonuclease/phosphatase (EEP) superfamily protein YafD
MLSLVAIVSLSCGSRPARTPRAVSPDRPHLRIMSYNVNYGLAGDPDIIDIIRSSGCDVVFLQETTPAWERSLRAGLGRTYPHMGFKRWSGAGGLAILSKHPFDGSMLIPPPEGGWFPAWRVVLHTPLGEIQALNVHLRPPVSDSGSVVSGYFTTDDIRLEQIKRYHSRLDASLPTLVAGDFNEPSDGHAVEYLAGLGLTSALEEFLPGQATWRWNTSVGTITSQLDHIVYDPGLEPVNAWVLKRGRSDHLPVIAIFERTVTRKNGEPGNGSRR